MVCTVKVTLYGVRYTVANLMRNLRKGGRVLTMGEGWIFQLLS
jgi:hypothetical protein